MNSLFAEYARHGWKLCAIEPGSKAPRMTGWNDESRAIGDPDVAEVLDGVGICHAYSQTCCIDFDDLAASREWFRQRGQDIDQWLTAPDAVMISSGRENRAKLLYRLEKPIPSFKLPGFELRCASSTGKTLQDALPGTIHPITGLPYTWVYGDELGHWSNLPEMPEGLATIWKAMVKPVSKIPKASSTFTVLTEADVVRRMLRDHDPDGGYDDWVGVGMALHHEFNGADEGLVLWNEWSSQGSKYKGEQDLAPHWRSFSSSHDNPRTLSSLRVEKAATLDDFAVVDAATAQQFEAERALAATRRAAPSNIREALNLLKRDKHGVLNTLPNVLTVLGLPEVVGQQIAFDTFQDGLMAAPVGTEEWRPILDTDYTALRVWMENIGNFYPVSKDMVRDAVHYLGAQNKMDTAQKWLNSLKWDGVPRIAQFMPMYMGTIDAQYERAVGKYLWTALAGRIMSPGCQVDMVPILVGKQGLGKSQGVKALVPNKDFYVEIRLDEQDDAIARKMRGTLVGELAELRGLRTTDLDRIKAFVTRTDEKWTPKYMEFSTTFSRRLVMIGTTNEDEFLVDDENRRWLPVRTMGVNVAAIMRDRDQLWAEAFEVWLAEGIQWEEAEGLARKAQTEYKVEDNWVVLVRDWLTDNGAGYLRIQDVLLQAVGLNPTQVHRTHELRIGRILRDEGYEKITATIGKQRGKYWVRSQDKPKEPTAEEAYAAVKAKHAAKRAAKPSPEQLDDILS